MSFQEEFVFLVVILYSTAHQQNPCRLKNLLTLARAGSNTSRSYFVMSVFWNLHVRYFFTSLCIICHQWSTCLTVLSHPYTCHTYLF
ncbi:hypothetical protein FB446DRAFT_748016 [Lentinula raphanica]|nr:hypothetical protein FB446DRAFT_748016 [Lentinula raphanica]